MISHNAPELSGGSGSSLSSVDELGAKPPLSISTTYPEEAMGQVERYVPEFLGFIGKLHDKYIDVIGENKFLSADSDKFDRSFREV